MQVKQGPLFNLHLLFNFMKIPGALQWIPLEMMKFCEILMTYSDHVRLPLTHWWGCNLFFSTGIHWDPVESSGIQLGSPQIQPLGRIWGGSGEDICDILLYMCDVLLYVCGISLYIHIYLQQPHHEDLATSGGHILRNCLLTMVWVSPIIFGSL